MDEANGSRAILARRQFLRTAAATGLGAAVGTSWPAGAARPEPSMAANLRPYDGPNVIIIRFGGGVRRRETIDSEHTYSPYLLRALAPRGVLFPQVQIDQLEGVETSHGQGTLYILTGKYDRYKDVSEKFLGQRFEAKVPTLFEYFRKVYAVPEHQSLIINGEDRTDEEFYTFSNHHLFGVEYRSTVLSLYRYKVHLLRRQLAEDRFSDRERPQKERELHQLENLDYRVSKAQHAPEIDAFWERWRRFYGETGLVNPRGDALLTELALWALRDLRPRLMMVNYNDPDYVHWGLASHYFRGISAIDQGLKRLVDAVEADDAYRGNTVFVVVPDCGRDDNRLMAVPFQHHFNSKSSHEIFAAIWGPGVARGQTVDKPVQQISVAATVGRLMGFPTEYAEGPPLEEVWA